MIVGGPEALVQSDQNRYTPEWVSKDKLTGETLEPETVQDLLSGPLPSQPPSLS